MRLRPRSSAPEAGSLTAFVVVSAVAIFLVMGLVVDAGRAFSARSSALEEAEQAARAGAGQLSVDAVRSGQFAIDPAQAVLAAEAYLAAISQPGFAVVSGQTVTVHIDTSESTVILGMIGVNRIGISVSASATDVHGVTRED